MTQRMPHLDCDDCWYSCPKSGGCCSDVAGVDCNCGADRINAYIEQLESENHALRTGAPLSWMPKWEDEA